jgi:DNA mismatch repair protein MutS
VKDQGFINSLLSRIGIAHTHPLPPDEVGGGSRCLRPLGCAFCALEIDEAVEKKVRQEGIKFLPGLRIAALQGKQKQVDSVGAGVQTSKGVKVAGRGKRKLTPMLAQYLSIKDQAGDAILFFRLGDFYELFFEDAERAAPILEVTLTSRNKGDPNPIPMCGVPYHAVDGYISKLLAADLNVAICDQVGDPSTAPGLVERDLVRIITPATVLEEGEGLRQTRQNHLSAMVRHSNGIAVGIATVEISTGELRVCLAPNLEAGREELGRISPREVLFPPDDTELEMLASSVTPAASPRGVPEARWAQRVDEELAKHLDGRIEEFSSAEQEALRRALAYIAETLRGGFEHLRAPIRYAMSDHLLLDERSRRNLAVVEGGSGTAHGSLWWVLDETSTSMGSRHLRDWLLYPLQDLARINERLDAIESLIESPGLRRELVAQLKAIGDFERLVARFGVGRAGPREAARLGRALEAASTVPQLLQEAGETALLGSLAHAAQSPPGLGGYLAETLADELPVHPTDGGVIRLGADPEVDRLRGLGRDAEQLLAELEARERAATGISSLKIRHHRVLGYFFEVTKPNLPLVPEHFVRRQSLASSERFATPELQELEQQLSTADARCREREAEIFQELLEAIGQQETCLTAQAAALAVVDVLVGLAEVAHQRNYVRPELHRGASLEVREGRHPVVERTSAAGSFVSNDVHLDELERQLMIITGPNMAGKSTYLRQVALITLMAHAGSFVPAASARISLTDRIWTRVGAGDDLVAGDSTFMVEMKETAAILSNLTSRTLVILDEIGRGTSTYDGIAIAWAVAEFLHDFEPAPGARAKTLFATHFHELVALEHSHPRVVNASVTVREWKDDVLFLRKVVDGPASRSYGIAVARLAGVPDRVVARARELLRNLEAGEGPGGPKGLALGSTGPIEQIELFGGPEATLRQAVAAIEVDTMTPLEALNRLHALVAEARHEDS